MSDGTRTVIKEMVSCATMHFSVEHNGFQGGDAGHGGYVSIKIGTDGTASIFLNGEETEGFSIRLEGDMERDVFVEGLKMIVTELETFTSVPPEKSIGNGN